MKFDISNNRSGYYLKYKWQVDNDGYFQPITFHQEKQPALLLTVASHTLPDNNAPTKPINLKSLYTALSLNISPDHTGVQIHTNKAKLHGEIKIKIVN